MSNFQDRMIRAAKLDVSLYEEVEADAGAMGQAMGIIVLSSLAAGIGNIARGGFEGLLLGAFLALVGWFVWAFLTYFIGTKLLPETQTHADYGELLRTIGFSSSPGLIRILGIIPVVGEAVFFFVSIWMLVAMVIAVRAALDYQSTFRAVVVCAIGWIIQMFLFALFMPLMG
jgi:hypothetical protein